jgi:CheY-like chemotaxis protein
MTVPEIPRPYIFAVDDESELLMLFHKSLTARGFKVRTSLNACDFWETMNQEQLDIIFLDIQMNGINGADLCRQLKNESCNASIPVVMLSASFNTEELAQACGADGFVHKPYSTEKIVTEIRRVLD